ncbi:unnamed protein product [Closterium sp. NIES-65]|nr:unnamed protein product [Closterium sp. NIES-65]
MALTHSAGVSEWEHHGSGSSMGVGAPWEWELHGNGSSMGVGAPCGATMPCRQTSSSVLLVWFVSGVSERDLSEFKRGVSGRGVSLVPVASSFFQSPPFLPHNPSPPPPTVLPHIQAGGGSGRHQPPPLSPPLCYDTHSAVPACRLVVDLGMLGVMLHQQPMMPITFYSSPPGVSKSMSQELMEEEITAFTLGMALHDPSTPEWSIYMPMAKSLVRALDATQLAARELLPHVPVEGFVSVGVSKRACMAWLSAALDKRVVAFISYGYDLINFQPNMQHLLDSLGAVPILGRFYVDYNLTRFLHTPQLRHILSYTDPYFFRERLTMPKLLIAASNDEFFLMDDS